MSNDTITTTTTIDRGVLQDIATDLAAYNRHDVARLDADLAEIARAVEQGRDPRLVLDLIHSARQANQTLARRRDDVVGALHQQLR